MFFCHSTIEMITDYITAVYKLNLYPGAILFFLIQCIANELWDKLGAFLLTTD